MALVQVWIEDATPKRFRVYDRRAYWYNIPDITQIIPGPDDESWYIEDTYLKGCEILTFTPFAARIRFGDKAIWEARGYDSW